MLSQRLLSGETKVQLNPKSQWMHQLFSQSVSQSLFQVLLGYQNPYSRSSGSTGCIYARVSVLLNGLARVRFYIGKGTMSY